MVASERMLMKEQLFVGQQFCFFYTEKSFHFPVDYDTPQH